ncbi:MAG: sigma-70 family RNA polymerase sigma factor [Cyclobacteriaceae bacterium]|nr:sigma-70 family RNA polymerase sigma factor [Cyclobacteriaceae bacterium]
MKKYRISDSELVSLYINGNEEAFKDLVLRHKNRVFTTIHLIVKDRYLAEDLLQETFIKAVTTIKSGRYNDEGKFLPWILRIGHNLAIDTFRRSKRYPTVLMEDGSNIFDNLEFAEPTIEDRQVTQDSVNKLKRHIQELPDSQKQVLIMRSYLDMSFKEIADETGVSINTALGRMRYALINLKKKMQESNLAYDKKNYP